MAKAKKIVSFGDAFWARGYFVSTVGADEEAVREYIKQQEDEDKQLELLGIDLEKAALSGSHFQATSFAGGTVI